MADVQPVASILLGYRIMRGTTAGPSYVRELLSDPGAVEWTQNREEAALFADRGQAGRVQELIVERECRCTAVVPYDPEAV